MPTDRHEYINQPDFGQNLQDVASVLGKAFLESTKDSAVGSLLRLSSLGIPRSQRPVEDEVRDYVLDAVTPMGGIFAGAKALKSVQVKRDLARHLLKEGTGRAKVRDKTGWFPGAADDELRWEINDKDAVLKPGVIGQLREYSQLRDYINQLKASVYAQYKDVVPGTSPSEKIQKIRELHPDDSGVQLLKERERDLGILRDELGAVPGEPLKVGDVYHHPELFENYPQLAEMELNPTRGSENLGAYYTLENAADPSISRKVVDLEADVTKHPDSTMIHELQHAVQEIEGFPRGGSSSGYRPLKDEIDYSMELAKEALKEKGYSLDISYGVNDRPTKYKVRLWGSDPDNYLSINELPEDVRKYVDYLNELEKEKIGTLFDEAARTPHGRYLNTAGEYESRIAERRALMERSYPGSSKNIYPWEEKPKYLIKKYHGEF